MKRIEYMASMVFGGIFLLLSLLVVTETLLRKFLNVSLQGVDELGGYALAVGATLSFTLALLGRAHMRIDIFHEKFPKSLQTLFNWLSATLMAFFGLFLFWVCLQIVLETLDYGSTAQTPWATPLKYPQGLWLAGLTVFAFTAFAYGLRATWLLLTGRSDQLNEEFHPKGVSDELKEELEDFKNRQQSTGSDEDVSLSNSVSAQPVREGTQ
ncbi:TRAP transporter small permease subunit [Oceanisphaera arctica]|uniref:TRAP transporter small permease protein n=1 Tax=Oceanisphaera arctica TaxID=641510 RepID=A0A2P5THT5_9GAMM|nr:TRAP transporter small permease [Oceanisphaera arctica]PPL14105.1 TRAP transporter small permease protein [Oceanisphaera arctica]GHA26061.1 C4-dicarboxylate ABC transporter permease [Oceanisphaera arctica]